MDVEAIRLLNVRDFAFQERNFEILVDINLLGTQVHDLVRLAESADYLVGGLSQLDGLGLGRCRCLLISAALLLAAAPC